MVTAFLSGSPALAEPIEPANLPSLVAAVRLPEQLDFCGEAVPLQKQEIRERFEKEMLISLWDRPQVILWLKRSRRFFPLIEEILTDSGMPVDLKYVAVAESALRPHARSSKAAVGYWQFIKATGRRYGLRINRQVDQRKNVFASTRAAIAYFKDLHEIFGSWTLSTAGYNMGEKRLKAEIEEQGVSTFYRLHLPMETQRYIFRILSAKLIFSDPKAYGFHLADDDYYPPLQFERIKIRCRQDTPIRIVAQAANTHFKAIKDLNPEIRGRYLPKGSHQVLIPAAAAAGFQNRYQQLLGAWSQSRDKQVYVVERGDSLSAIARRFNVPLTALILWNHLDPYKPIHPGDRLIIHNGKQ
jgi:hypothetical protein